MTYTVKHTRTGLTAIAAVLALSSTPLAAQDTTVPPDPVTEATVAEEPAAEPATQASASEPAAAEAAVEPTTTEAAAPAPTTRRTATRSKTPSMVARRAASEPAAAEPAAVAPAAQMTGQPLPVPPPADAIVDPGPMPVEEAAIEETEAMPADDALPIAAAAGLGLLALGGIGLAIGRRRQRREELAHQRANREYLASHPDTPKVHAPAAFAGTAAMPAMASSGPGRRLKDVPRTRLPEGFDLSRFGPHVRAAYLGPTEDNPSLSLKHRLRRAAAMDQKLRQHGETSRDVARDEPRVAQRGPADQPIWNSGNGSFMLRRSAGKPVSKPAFQR